MLLHQQEKNLKHNSVALAGVALHLHSCNGPAWTNVAMHMLFPVVLAIFWVCYWVAAVLHSEYRVSLAQHRHHSENALQFPQWMLSSAFAILPPYLPLLCLTFPCLVPDIIWTQLAVSYLLDLHTCYTGWVLVCYMYLLYVVCALINCALNLPKQLYLAVCRSHIWFNRSQVTLYWFPDKMLDLLTGFTTLENCISGLIFYHLLHSSFYSKMNHNTIVYCVVSRGRHIILLLVGVGFMFGVMQDLHELSVFSVRRVGKLNRVFDCQS